MTYKELYLLTHHWKSESWRNKNHKLSSVYGLIKGCLRNTCVSKIVSHSEFNKRSFFEMLCLLHHLVEEYLHKFFFFFWSIALWFLPWEIRVAFPGEIQVEQSRATQPAMHHGYSSVSIIHQTLPVVHVTRIFNVHRVSQSQLSVQTLSRCPYTSVCNRMHLHLCARLRSSSPCQSSIDSGNTKISSMHRRLGSAALSQLAFPGEGNPNFLWEKSHWDNIVVKKRERKKEKDFMLIWNGTHALK